MYEYDLGTAALFDLEDNDITAATVTYNGNDYPCSATVLNVDETMRAIGVGLTPTALVQIYIRKAVLPDGVNFNQHGATGKVGHFLSLTRKFNGDQFDLKIADNGRRDLVIGYELTCVDQNEGA